MDNESLTPKHSNLRWLLIILIILIIAASGYLLWNQLRSDRTSKNADSQSESKSTTTPASWKEQSVAIPGKFADAEVITLSDGKYRIYYSVEPEVSGNNLEIYSSTSTDGINWTKEEGIRKTMATFPDIVKLSDGKWRMYFQNAGVIKSATSTDGLTWVDEPGIRVDKTETGYTLENVGAQSTTILADGSYIMVYRGTITEAYKTTEKLPNSDTHIYFWATSTDGLTFAKKGIAIDSRNEILLGAADGADFVNFDGELRIYFWSYTGVYHAVYTTSKFSTPIFDWTNNKDSKIKFAENPPGDPTLIKINDTWYMYYGQHTKGIYFATLN